MYEKLMDNGVLFAVTVAA